MRTTLLAAVVMVMVLVGCRETPLVPDANPKPIADAQFMNGGKSVDEKVAAMLMDPSVLVIPFSGQPVAVTLNGSASTDDSEIKKYYWLSGDSGGDAGPKRGVDPQDIAQPVVMLGQGTHSFVLWVTDDQGVISPPDTVTITVGVIDPANDPAVIECVANVVPTVAEPCKMCVCAASPDCRTNSVQTVCNADCWALLSCIGAMCPNYMTEPGCVTEKCATFLGGGAGAMKAGACVAGCAATCRPPPA